MSNNNRKGLSSYEAALIALDAYNDESKIKNLSIRTEKISLISRCEGWEEARDWNLLGESVNKFSNSGMFARCYIHPAKQLAVVAFRGSESPFESFANVNDWQNNYQIWYKAQQGQQYKDAMAFAKNAMTQSAKRNYRFLGFTGHSLGGGLAALAALKQGSYAVTFNPAPIQKVVENLRDDVVCSHVMNYVSSSDYVSRLNPFMNFITEGSNVAGSTVLGGFKGFVESTLLSAKELGPAIGEALAATVGGAHKLIPGLTIVLQSSSGHGMADLVAFMHVNRSKFSGDPWPHRA